MVLNRFQQDTPEEIEAIREGCQQLQVPFTYTEGYARGPEGSREAAQMIVSLTEGPASPIQHTYALSDRVETKLRKIVQRIYGGKDIYLDKKARQQLKRIEESEYAHLPVCIAKTQYSFTDTPEDIHVYEGFTISIDELVVNAGAGFIVAICGEMVRMPGLSSQPAALDIDVVDGNIVGLGG